MNRAIASSTYKPWRFKIIPIKDIFWTFFGFLIFIPIELTDGLFLSYFQIAFLFFLSQIQKSQLCIVALYSSIVVLSVTVGDEIRLTSIINPILIAMAFLIKVKPDHQSHIIRGIYISAVIHTFVLIYTLSQASIATLYALLVTRDWASSTIPYFGNGFAMGFAVVMLFAAKEHNWKLLLILFVGGILTTSRVPIFSIAIITFFYLVRRMSLKNFINITAICLLTFLVSIYLYQFYNLAEQLDGILDRFTYASDRSSAYSSAVASINEHPFLGVGSKNIEYFFHSHNSYLQIIYKHGIFAFILWFILMYMSILKNLISFRNIDFLLIFFLISFFQIGLLNPCIILLFVIYRQFVLDKNLQNSRKVYIETN
jgi:hypothetical protein